jgi:hypothetical protein
LLVELTAADIEADLARWRAPPRFDITALGTAPYVRVFVGASATAAGGSRLLDVRLHAAP